MAYVKVPLAHSVHTSGVLNEYDYRILFFLLNRRILEVYPAGVIRVYLSLGREGDLFVDVDDEVITVDAALTVALQAIVDAAIPAPYDPFQHATYEYIIGESRKKLPLLMLNVMTGGHQSIDSALADNIPIISCDHYYSDYIEYFNYLVWQMESLP